VYKVPEEYENYYNDYISRNSRELNLDCTINGNPIDQSKISSVKIEYDLIAGAEEYIVGNLAAAKLTMVVSHDITVYETNEINLVVNLKIIDKYSNEVFVPVPLGKFYIFESSSSSNLSRTITAYDNLYTRKLEYNYRSELEYPTTVHKILDEVCETLGITYDNRIINMEINRPEVVYEKVGSKYKESKSNQVCLDMKIGETLTYLASYLGGNFIVDGDCCLRLIKFPNEVARTLDSTNYAKPTIGTAVYNMNQIECTIHADNVIKVSYDESSSSMNLINPLMTRSRLYDLLDELNNIEYYQSQARVKGDPRFQLGDLIELVEKDEFGYIINKSQIPILRMSFSYTGGCSNEISAPCKAESEKTINYKGTVTSRIDSIESAVSSIREMAQELYDSINTLYTVNDSILLVDRFLREEVSSSTSDNYDYIYISDESYNKYNYILNKIEENDAIFEDEYEEIYNNKFL
jgi:hypothetical protein